MDFLKEDDLLEYSIWYLLLFSYFLGMTFSRIGSLVLEGIMLEWKLMEEINYPLLVKAEQKDSKVMLLLEVCNTFRTLSAMFLVLTILMLSEKCTQIGLAVSNLKIGGCFFLFVIFLLSFRKQYNYVRKRTEVVGN